MYKRDRRMSTFCFSYISRKMHITQLKMSDYTRSSLVLYRIPEVIFMLATGGVAVALAYSGKIIPPNRMTIPDIQFTSNGANYSVNNPTNSYPINLNGYSCVASDLLACIASKQSGATLSAGCCSELYDMNVDPYQTVTSAFVIFLGIVIPFIVFIVRALMWRVFINRQYLSLSGAHATPPCSPYSSCCSLQGMFFMIFSVSPGVFDYLLRLHSSSGDTINGINWDSTDRKKKSNRVMCEEVQIGVEGATDPDASDDARYEILDSNGNTITKQRAEGREGNRDIEQGERGEPYVLSETFLKAGSSPPSSSPLQHMFWLLLIYEPSFALAVSSAFQAIISLGLKRYVGAPRPNYYALVAWSSVYVADRAKEAASARMSFPSGHSATAAGGLGVLILVLLRDIKHLKRRYNRITSNNGYASVAITPTGREAGRDVREGRETGREEHDFVTTSNVMDTVLMIVIFSLLLMLSVCLVFWIGGSRIKDYFHFAPDVIAGWLIGATTAYLSQDFRAMPGNIVGAKECSLLLSGATEIVHSSLL